MALSAAAQQSLSFALGVNGNALAQEIVDAINGITALPSANIIVGSAGGVATDVALSGDATISNTGVLTLAAQVANGTNVKNTANVNVIGGIPVIHRITAAALTGDIDVVLTHKTRILDVQCVAVGAGGAADTIIVKNVATAITDAIDMNVADKAVKRAGTIDTAQWDIAAGAIMRISGASAVTCEVIVYGIRVA